MLCVSHKEAGKNHSKSEWCTQPQTFNTPKRHACRSRANIPKRPELLCRTIRYRKTSPQPLKNSDARLRRKYGYCALSYHFSCSSLNLRLPGPLTTTPTPSGSAVNHPVNAQEHSLGTDSQQTGPQSDFFEDDERNHPDADPSAINPRIIELLTAVFRGLASVYPG